MTLKQLIIAIIVGIGGIVIYLSTLSNAVQYMAKTDNVFFMVGTGLMTDIYHKISIEFFWTVLKYFMERGAEKNDL